MTKTKKTWMTLGALLCAWVLGGRAEAAVGSPSYLNINVSVTASRSVAVNGYASSTVTASSAWNTSNPNQLLVQGASVTVKNDSNVVEKWALSTQANSINTQGNAAKWTMKNSTGTAGAGLPGSDEYAVQAVFGSSRTYALGGNCPASGSSDWDATSAQVLDTPLVTYTNTVFADTSAQMTNDGQATPDGATGNMSPSNQRALCWRIVAPSATSTTDTQNIQVIVTAQP